MLRAFARGLTPSLLPMSRNIAIFNVFAIKTKLWLVRSIINTESSETGSLIKNPLQSLGNMGAQFTNILKCMPVDNACPPGIS